MSWPESSVMAVGDLSDRAAVLAALDECDRVGRDTFLERHGFGRARDYFLEHDGRMYDSKAIVGVAHGYQFGKQLKAPEFSGGEQVVVPVLERLGFTVRSTQARPGIWREGAREVRVSKAEAEEAWAAAAYPVLEEVASRYGSVVYYKEVAERIQDLSGIRTTMLLSNWIGRVLGKVLHRTADEGKPPLTALVVRAEDGGVGDGYDESLVRYRGRPATSREERERFAAEDRLDCYRRYAKDVPEGARPRLTPQLEERLRTKKARPETVPAVCPTCYMQLPASGHCDACD